MVGSKRGRPRNDDRIVAKMVSADCLIASTKEVVRRSAALSPTSNWKITRRKYRSGTIYFLGQKVNLDG